MIFSNCYSTPMVSVHPSRPSSRSSATTPFQCSRTYYLLSIYFLLSSSFSLFIGVCFSTTMKQGNLSDLVLAVQCDWPQLPSELFSFCLFCAGLYTESLRFDPCQQYFARPDDYFGCALKFIRARMSTVQVLRDIIRAWKLFRGNF